jgi:broad specificity phosphatase PhoE
MEPLPKIVERLGAFLRDIVKEAEGKNILISTHAIAMKGALEYLTPQSKGSYWAKNIGNCDIYASEVRNGTYSVPVCIEDGKDRWEGAQ